MLFCLQTKNPYSILGYQFDFICKYKQRILLNIFNSCINAKSTQDKMGKILGLEDITCKFFAR